MSQASEYAAGAPAPERVHVGEPKDLFPAPFVGQRVALRTPSRGQEVRLFTVAKVSEADGDVVAELERVGPIGSSTERFDVLWRVRESLTEGRYPFGLTGFVDIRSRLPPEVEAVTNAFREDDVQAMPWHPLPPAVMPAVTAAQAKTFLDGVADFLKKDPASIGIELRGDAGVHMRCGWSEGRPFVVQFRLRTHPLTADDVAAYRALAPEGAEEALQRPYPAVGEASVLSLGRFPGLECYTDCPDWAAVDPVGEAPRGDFHNLTARLSTAGEGENTSVVLQVAPWWLHDAPPKAGDLLPLRLCDFACPGNAFLAQARLGSEHVPVLTNLAALPNHAIVSKPYEGGFLTQSCTWRPDIKLLKGTEVESMEEAKKRGVRQKDKAKEVRLLPSISPTPPRARWQRCRQPSSSGWRSRRRSGTCSDPCKIDGVLLDPRCPGSSATRSWRRTTRSTGTAMCPRAGPPTRNWETG